MKIAILGDPHFGARNDSEVFYDFQEMFYTNVFLPKIKKENIKHIVNMGDTFDRRKYVNFKTLKRVKSFFFEPLREMGVACHTIVGNHDVFHKNTNFINSPDLLLGEYSNVIVYSEIGPLKIKGFDATIIPWINGENEESTLKYILQDKNPVAFGHLEIGGFEMDPGIICTEGTSANVFKRYERVFSGHFHHKSSGGNIMYVGNPYELTWTDCGDVRGYHIYDTETDELQFFENPYKMFHKLVYDDSNGPVSVPDLNLTDKYVKVILVKKTNPIAFDNWFDALYHQNPADLQVVEPSLANLDVEMDEEDLKNAVKDSRAFLRDYVQEIGIAPTNEETSQLLKFMDELYTEAQNEC